MINEESVPKLTIEENGQTEGVIETGEEITTAEVAGIIEEVGGGASAEVEIIDNEAAIMD